MGVVHPGSVNNTLIYIKFAFWSILVSATKWCRHECNDNIYGVCRGRHLPLL